MFYHVPHDNCNKYEMPMTAVLTLTGTDESMWRIYKNNVNDKILYEFNGYVCEHYNDLKIILGMYV